MHRRRLIAAMATLFTGCGQHKDAPLIPSHDVSSDTLVLQTDSAGNSVVEGFGFLVPVPRGTTLERQQPTGAPVYYAILGPKRPTPERTPDQGPSGPEPTFEVNVSIVTRNLAGTLDRWVDSLRRAQNKDADPVLGQIDTAETDNVGRRRALRLRPFCGDCDPAEIYVASNRRVISFSFATGIHLAGTSTDQRTATRRVLDSIRWLQ